MFFSVFTKNTLCLYNSEFKPQKFSHRVTWLLTHTPSHVFSLDGIGSDKKSLWHCLPPLIFALYYIGFRQNLSFACSWMLPTLFCQKTMCGNSCFKNMLNIPLNAEPNKLQKRLVAGGKLWEILNTFLHTKLSLRGKWPAAGENFGNLSVTCTFGNVFFWRTSSFLGSNS